MVEEAATEARRRVFQSKVTGRFSEIHRTLSIHEMFQRGDCSKSLTDPLLGLQKHFLLTFM